MIAVPERVKIVMRMLEGAANADLRCPSNCEIAAALGASSPSVSAGTVALLEAMGLISVERGRMARVVTIVASGKRTQGVIKRPVNFQAYQKNVPTRFWTRSRDATLMEAISQGLDFEQAANWTGTSTEECAARFDTLAARFGAQAA